MSASGASQLWRLPSETPAFGLESGASGKATAALFVNRCHVSLSTGRHDLQRLIRQRPLQRDCVIDRAIKPRVKLLLGCKQNWHCLGVNWPHDGIRFRGQECEETMLFQDLTSLGQIEKDIPNCGHKMTAPMTATNTASENATRPTVRCSIFGLFEGSVVDL
jgi:hypothetical protein